MRNLIAVATASLAVGAGAVSAQEIPATLDLRQALDLAETYNPAYKRAQTQLRSSRAQVLSSKGAFLPNLSASLSFSGFANTTGTAFNDFGEPVENPNPVTVTRSSTSQGIQTDITLFDGFRNVNQLRQANNDLDATGSGVELSLIQMEANVARSYFDALQRQRLIGVEERLLASANERFDINQRRFRAAAASQVDVLGAEVDAARQELSLDQAEGNASQAALRLLEQVGVNPDMTGLEVVGAFPEVFDPRERWDVDSLVAFALDAHPRVAQARFQQAAASNASSGARGARLPSLSARLSFGRSASLPGGAAWWDFNPSDRSWNWGLNVSVPLFNRFQTSQQIASADAQRMSAEEDLRAARLLTEQEVRTGFIDLVNAFEGVQIARRALELSRQQLNFAQEQYRTGGTTFLQLQQVIDRASQEERQSVTAEYQFAIALVTLQERMGLRISGNQ